MSQRFPREGIASSISASGFLGCGKVFLNQENVAAYSNDGFLGYGKHFVTQGKVCLTGDSLNFISGNSGVDWSVHTYTNHV